MAISDSNLRDSSARKNQDLYGRKLVDTGYMKPITADMATLVWATDGALNTSSTADSPGILTGATNVNISYQQGVTRRYTLGTRGGRPLAVIYPTRPVGTLAISKLFVGPDPGKLFALPGWNICEGTAIITVRFDGTSAYDNCSSASGKTFGGFQLLGATVTGYNIGFESEGLTVVDNISVEFLQMIRV